MNISANDLGDQSKPSGPHTICSECSNKYCLIILINKIIYAKCCTHDINRASKGKIMKTANIVKLTGYYSKNKN